MKILVAEDENVVALQMCKLLEKQGHKAVHARTGKEALKALSNEYFDIVLMDIEMPEMNGLEATRTIRRAPDAYATIPIIGVSSNSAPPVDEQCHEAGMNHFIRKPFTIPRFEEALWQTKSHDTLKGFAAHSSGSHS